MKQFDFYEFTGILAPGAVLLVGICLIYPGAGLLLLGKDVSFGELGLFVILAYVAGHLMQAVSSILEPLYLRMTSGKPSTWVFSQTPSSRYKLLSQPQIEAVQEQLPVKLGLSLPQDLSSLSEGERLSIVSQVYAAVQKSGRSGRVDIFNGNYSMLRGLAAAYLVVLALMFINLIFHFSILIALLLALVATVYRMHRFSRHYARDLFIEFLQLPNPTDSQATTPTKETAVE
jgi:hypothetical protein